MADDESILSDETLLRICRVSQEDLEAMPALGEELRLARQLIPPPRSHHDGRLEHLVALLVSVLGKLPQHDLPIGYNSPGFDIKGWVERDALEQLAKQIVGMAWLDVAADQVASHVYQAVTESIRLGLLDSRDYDAWCPGMSSGSGWRIAVTATPYGITKARTMGQRKEDATAKPPASSPLVQRNAQDPPWARQPKPEADDGRNSNFCRVALENLKRRAEGYSKQYPSLQHMLVLPEGEYLRVPPPPGGHPLGGSSHHMPPAVTFGESKVAAVLPPEDSWPCDLEPIRAVVAEQEFSPYRPLAQKPYRVHLFFGNPAGMAALQSLAADLVNLSDDVGRAIFRNQMLDTVFYHSPDCLHGKDAEILDAWLCTVHWWAWKAVNSPIHTQPHVVFGGSAIPADRRDHAVDEKLSFSILDCDIFAATAATIDLFFRFFKQPPDLVWPADYPPEPRPEETAPAGNGESATSDSRECSQTPAAGSALPAAQASGTPGQELVNPLNAASASAKKVIDEPVERTISEVTRRNIFDALRTGKVQWAGRLSETEFLARLYDLGSMPSTDHRFRDASGDIAQHRVLNPDDWPDDWVYSDSRFDLTNGPDDAFLRFLCQIVHPLVQPDEQAVKSLVAMFNTHLAADGWEIAKCQEISGKPVFIARPTLQGRGPVPFVGFEAVQDGSMFDPPDPEGFQRLSTSDLRYIAGMWDSAHLEIMEKVLSGDHVYVGHLLESMYFHQLSRLTRAALEAHQIDSKPIYRLQGKLVAFGVNGASLSDVQEVSTASDGAVERLRAKLSSETDISRIKKHIGNSPRDLCTERNDDKQGFYLKVTITKTFGPENLMGKPPRPLRIESHYFYRAKDETMAHRLVRTFAARFKDYEEKEDAREAETGDEIFIVTRASFSSAPSSDIDEAERFLTDEEISKVASEVSGYCAQWQVDCLELDEPPWVYDPYNPPLYDEEHPLSVGCLHHQATKWEEKLTPKKDYTHNEILGGLLSAPSDPTATLAESIEEWKAARTSADDDVADRNFDNIAQTGQQERMIGAGSNGDPSADGNWVFEELPDGEVRARNRRLCERYGALNLEDLLLLCHQWRQMAVRFTAATKRAGKYHGHVVHDEKVQEVTKILETAIVARQMDGASRLSRCLRRPDDDHLHHALATLDVLEAKLRAETCESGVLQAAGDGADDGAGADTQQTDVLEVPAPCTACYAELDVPTPERGTLKILFTKPGAGRPAQAGTRVVERQQLAILLAGVEAANRRRREADEGSPSGRLPEEQKMLLQWSSDSLKDCVKDTAGAKRGAIRNVRRLVRFQNDVGLVTNQDTNTKMWTSTVPFRLRVTDDV